MHPAPTWTDERPDSRAGDPAPPPAADAHGPRTWTLWSPEGPVDVEVDAADTDTVDDVLDALSRSLGLAAGSLWAGSAPLPASTPLSAEQLRHGAALGLGRARPRGRSAGLPAPRDGALELHVVGGPEAGRVVALSRGQVVLGRGDGCDVAFDDPDVSRRHVLVGVGGGRVTATDLGSSNGTLLRTPTGTTALGVEAVPWPVDATLFVGSSAVRLTGPRGASLDCSPAAGGRVHVRPLRVSAAPPPDVAVPLPATPADRPRRRLGWVAVAVPAVAGLLMAWLFATPQFLFFALLSPVVAVGSWLSDRTSGRRDRRRSAADHRTASAEAESRITAAVAGALAALDQAHPDPAVLTTAVRRRSSPLWSRAGDLPGPLTVRLGLGPGATTVSRVGADGQRTPVVAEHLPVVLDLAASGGLGVVAPRRTATGVLRCLLLQLVALVPPGDLRVVVATPADRAADWRWTSWLPHLAGVVSPGGWPGCDLDAHLLEVVGESACPRSPTGPTAGLPTTVVVLDAAVRPETVAALTAAEHVLCLTLASAESRLAVPPAACVTVIGETGVRGRLRQRGRVVDRELTLDTVPEPVAEATTRSLAALAAPAVASGLPDSSQLLALPGHGLRLDPVTGTVAGSWRRDRGALVCVLGEDEQGPVTLDLCASGPHALVAGTTGSGKSELLQTLVTGLALHQPPDRLSLLLIDYKGGAAFAEAAGLPHTVGLLTDLDSQSTGRALRSLAAELTRRERLLAGHGVRDVADLATDVLLPRLVIVVDEFATLAEELPGFVSGLVGIAQRGRSLGVHLVLATQRPSGVVSPEIRANCSLRICLRTTDESDSRDVLGSPLAAALPLRRPGRAYLRVGSAAPVLLQVARVARGPGPRPAGVRVRQLPWPPGPQSAPSVLSSPDAIVAGDLTRVAAALRSRAAQEQLAPAARPWLPPLPDRLPAEDLDRRTAPERGASELWIGLVDGPDTQSQDPLVLDLAAGGGWLAVGGPRSGRTTALRTVLREAVHRLPPSRLQVHVLDHGGGGLADEVGRLPHGGTTVYRDDPHRTGRLVARLQTEVDQRRTGGPGDAPAVLLLVDGWESVAAQLDDADPGAGSSSLLRLVREGAAAGLTCVLTADRAVPGSRLAAAVSTRLVLPLPDRADYAVAGVPPRAVPGSRPPGRALVGEDAAECQLALSREPAPREDDGAAADLPGAASLRPTISVVPLPADPVVTLPAAGADRGGLWLTIGPGDDEGDMVGIDLVRSGGLLVAGPPGSGRTAALAAFALHCRHAGAQVAHLGSVPGTRTDSTGVQHIEGSDLPALRAWAAASAGRPAVVVADDVTALPEATADGLAALARPAGELLVLAAGGPPELAGAFRGPTVALRRNRTALLLRPAPGDAQLLGLRVPRAPLPARPGSGWLVVAGTVTRVQVARRRTAAPAVPRRPAVDGGDVAPVLDDPMIGDAGLDDTRLDDAVIGDAVTR